MNDTSASPLTQVTLSVAAGADGSFPLYQDAGEGNGYQSGQSTTTPISWSDASRTLTIGADTGSFSGAATQRAYTLRLTNTVAPTAVFSRRHPGARRPRGRTTRTSGPRTVTTASLPVNAQHTVSLTGSATANPTSGEVIGDAGLCLDTRGGTTANGTALQLYTCNHSTAQQVTYTANGTTGGTLQVLGKCLDASNAGTANGTPIQLYDCNTTGSQNWVAQSNGELINPQSGRCLTVPGGNTTPGAVQLQLQDCSDSRCADLEAAARAGQRARRPVRGRGQRRSGVRGQRRSCGRCNQTRRPALVHARRQHDPRVRQVPGRQQRRARPTTRRSSCTTATAPARRRG